MGVVVESKTEKAISKTKKSLKIKNIVVIGNGMVGYKFCEKLINESGKDTFNITVFGEEALPAYNRVQLSSYFKTSSMDKLTLAKEKWYLKNKINLHLNNRVSYIDTSKKIVYSIKGFQVPYDKLVFATGSAPFVPPISGIERKGVFVYRTIDDLDSIMAYAKNLKTGAVIGGGLLGLEAAKGLLDLEIKTHIVEFAPRLMPNQLDSRGGGLLKEKIEALGIECHVNKSTQVIEGDDEGKVKKMIFSDETELPVDMIIVSAGIRPRDELAKQFGLEVGKRGGIVVDDYMQTSDKDIFAIGECALYNSTIYGLVAPGYDMATVVVSQLIGKNTKYHGDEMMSTNLKLIGVEVASFGDAFARNDESRSIEYYDKHTGVYKRINISKDGQFLTGGMLVGDAKDYNMLLQTVNNKIPLPQNPQDIIFGNTSSSHSKGIAALPPEAIICSCENISKYQIKSAIQENSLSDMAGIVKSTKAGKGCGGCKPMLAEILDETLKESGKVVKKIICEHFKYTRVELYGIIKEEKLKSFDMVIEKKGSGSGCEICKPLVASLLASIWHEPILSQKIIQDTNDKFLANIQKGGTYSVVPRVPGGEITPKKLELLGEVADKFNLYTKITSAQRIGLFGAQVHQLPDIWKELIEGGFESGHAYGKALRTVKSCIGSTWCRFGVDDSVGLAIQLENRYKGLRAPHKFKMGVSGCNRECAEAVGKDAGLIATENGWNLYVGGNGGSSPQPGKLLASDIDVATCINYIDRFLMYYIETAEPLQRTAPWLNKLDGGIEKLKEVIVEDSLGMAKSYEKQMQKMVDNYQCEWKNTINDKDKLKSFTHFVNSDDADPSIEFVDIRGQKSPVAW